MKKINHHKVIAAYHQGVQDRIKRQTPRPPKSGPARKAYINGFHSK